MKESTKRANALRLEKSRKGVFNVIYGRTIIVVLLVFIQAILLFSMFTRLGNYITYAYSGYMLLSIFVALVIINRPKNPSINLSWAIIVLVVPVIGGILYLYVELQVTGKLFNHRARQLIARTRMLACQDEPVLKELEKEDKAERNLAEYLYKYGNFPVSEARDVVYFSSGEEKFEEMKKRLNCAKKFIFMEYFIVKRGEMWDEILEILKRKVSEGVEVRVMYDGMCSLALLPFSYPKEIGKYGIQCRMFDPIYPVLSTHYNNRDHRKILVIDGEYAFTGGVNLSDEYINKVELYGRWKDAAVMVTGGAVKSFTLLFLQMWGMNRGKEENEYEKYLATNDEDKCGGKGYLIPYGDSPHDAELVGEMVYLDIINRAKDYVHIMSPYFVPDNEILTALKFAAKRGVEVVLILPHIPDKKYALALAKTHYKELVRAGVKLYEYTPGFIHSKVFSSDDIRGVVGTINLDYRSLYMNFECATYMYKVAAIKDIEEDFEETLKICHRVTLEDIKKEKIMTRFVGKILKPFAPLM